MKEKETVLIKVASSAIAISTVAIIISAIMPKRKEVTIKLPGKKPDRVSFRGHCDNAVTDDEVECI